MTAWGLTSPMKKLSLWLFPLAFLLTSFNSTSYQFVAFGDSLTAGVGASDVHHRFTNLIEDEFGPLNNQGKYPKIVNQYAAVLAYTGFEPNVIMLSGFNDMRTLTTPDMYRYYLDKILEIFASNGRRVYLGNCLRMTPDGYAHYYYNPGDGPARAEAFNQVQREVAAKYPGFVVVVSMDGYNPYNVSADGFHPNDAGYRQIYEAFSAAIRAGPGAGQRVYLPVVVK